ncbi:hypothetical protein J3E64_001170 [Sphingobium sp. OAS761]|nr:hypothetical protein [Sphingobium sp. OAS761]
MHKNDFTPGAKNEIRRPWQGSIMEPVSETKPMDETAYRPFWAGVLAAHKAHALGSLLW